MTLNSPATFMTDSNQRVSTYSASHNALSSSSFSPLSPPRPAGNSNNWNSWYFYSPSSLPPSPLKLRGRKREGERGGEGACSTNFIFVPVSLPNKKFALSAYLAPAPFRCLLVFLLPPLLFLSIPADFVYSLYFLVIRETVGAIKVGDRVCKNFARRTRTRALEYSILRKATLRIGFLHSLSS